MLVEVVIEVLFPETVVEEIELDAEVEDDEAFVELESVVVIVVIDVDDIVIAIDGLIEVSNRSRFNTIRSPLAASGLDEHALLIASTKLPRITLSS